MDLSVLNLVRPLRAAENIFLEVLISRFRLYKENQGCTLDIRFDDSTHAIWTREAKYLMPKILPNFAQKAQEYQEQLDAFLLNTNHSPRVWTFDDDDFPFRYASGGALPILRMGRKEYYCLFYHESFPVGWNIANGGCRSINELLNPINAIERELQGELIVVDPAKRKRYVFRLDDTGTAIDRPECAYSYERWHQFVPGLELPNFEVLSIPLKWLNGPDSVKVTYANDPERRVTDCFLNINANDYGIEVDRVAKISVDEDVILCDGEISRDRLFNRPIGLFEVGRIRRNINRESKFIPDIFYYNAHMFDGSKIQNVMDSQFIPEVTRIRTRTQMEAYHDTRNKFGMTPVTSRIIRHNLFSTPPTPRTCDIFISFASEDSDIAEIVYNFLKGKRCKAFFSKENRDPDFQIAIDDALDSAVCFIAVATKAEHLKKNFPKFEIDAFSLDILNNRKPSTARMISFISGAGFSHLDLPRPLPKYQALVFDRKNLEPSLQRLYEFVRETISRSKREHTQLTK